MCSNIAGDVHNKIPVTEDFKNKLRFKKTKALMFRYYQNVKNQLTLCSYFMLVVVPIITVL